MGFFDIIVDFFEVLFSMINNFVSSVLMLTNILQNVIQLPGMLLTLLPAALGASVLAVISIGIVKLLLGWGNS